MERKNGRSARLGRALAWLALAILALSLICFFCHLGCCHGDEAANEACPVCETFIQYTRLFRLIGLLGAFFLLINSLSGMGAGAPLFRPALIHKATLVSLRVKLTD